MPRSTPSAQTQVYAALDDQAGAEVNRVIAANAGAAIKSAH